MADFGALEYALVDGLVFDTTAGTYDSGTLEAALVDGWVLVASAAAGGILTLPKRHGIEGLIGRGDIAMPTRYGLQGVA